MPLLRGLLACCQASNSPAIPTSSTEPSTRLVDHLVKALIGETVDRGSTGIRARHRRRIFDVARSIAILALPPLAEAQACARVRGGVLVLIMLRPLPDEAMIAVSPGRVSSIHCGPDRVQTWEPPSCSTTVALPRCERMSRMVPRTP